jgi:hypothetical protein
MISILNHVAMAVVLAALAMVLSPSLDLGQVATWASAKTHMVVQEVAARTTHPPSQTWLYSQSLSVSLGISQWTVSWSSIAGVFASHPVFLFAEQPASWSSIDGRLSFTPME